MPNLWTERSIGECLSSEFAGEWGAEPSSGGNATVLRSTDIDDEGHVEGGVRRTITSAKVLAKKLQPGDILLEASGGGPAKPVGRVALFRGGDGAYLCSNFFRTLRPNQATVDPRFLAWRLQYFYAQPGIRILQQQTTGIINLKYRDYLRAPVRLPPLPVQRCIAEILDALDAAIRKTEQIIAKLRQVKQGLLHDLLTRGIDDNGELRDPHRHPEQFKGSPLGRVPTSWAVRTLNDLVDALRPVVYGILMPGTGHPGGVPVIKVKDIVGGEIRTDELLLTSPAIDYEYRRSRVNEGDLLFTIRGTVGRMATVPSRLANANITQDTARIAIRGANVSFVRHFLAMPEPQRFIKVHVLGVAVQGINLRDVRRIPIAAPPRPEADEVARRLDAAEDRITLESEAAAKLHLLRHGIMEDLLTGRVRVTSLLKETTA